MIEEKTISQQAFNGNKPQPTTEDIRKRAFEIYRARSGSPGSEMNDWLKAESQLREGLATAGQCPRKLGGGRLCTEELIGVDEPLIHHAEGTDQIGFTHHSCKLGHAWHRYMNDGLMTPCDCTGHARGPVG